MDKISHLLGESSTLIDDLLSTNAQTVIFCSIDYGVLNLAAEYIKNVLKAEVFEIAPDESNSIKIEQARAIINSSINTHAKNRYFIIHHADTMNKATQNSLLKLFEEPNSRNYFFLMSNNYRRLLPTVISRSKVMKLSKISRESIKNSLAQRLSKFSKDQISQMEFIAQDNVEIWQKMIGEKDYFESRAMTAKLAKQIISSKNLYDRIKLIKQIGKDRQLADSLAEVIIKIYKTLLKRKPTNQSLEQLEKWSNVRDALAMNSSVQLTLTLAVI